MDFYYYYYPYIIYLVFFLFASNYTVFFIIPRGVFASFTTHRCRRSRHRRRLGRLYIYIDPARRRSRRFALLFAKKLFRNKFTRAMTLVIRRRRACTRIFRT